MSEQQAESRQATGRLLGLLALIGAASAGCRELPSLDRMGSVDTGFRRQLSYRDAKLDLQFCSLPSAAVEPQLKILFIVDQSGSNRLTEGGGPGTDPTGLRRYGPLRAYVDDFVVDAGVSAGLVTFNDGAVSRVAHSLPATPTVPATTVGFAPLAGVTSTAPSADIFRAVAATRIEDDGLPADRGWTDYLSALQTANRLIREDICTTHRRAADGQLPVTFYSVIFISDGRPQINENTPQTWAQIQPAVDRLISVDPQASRRNEGGVCEVDETAYVERIFFHTAYYYRGTPDPTARQMLQQMAERAQGQALVFPEEIDLSSLTPPRRRVRQVLKDVFVENINWTWEDGDMKPDADGDGLSDEFERSLESAAAKADSDENGVNDHVEYVLYGRPCRDSACRPEQATQFRGSVCRQSVSAGAASGPVTFLRRAGDVLNDCERTLLKASVEQFSTHRGWMPDWLLFKQGLNVTTITPTDLLADLDSDGLSNYEELKRGTPVRFPNGQISGLDALDFRLRITGEVDGDSQCYRLVLDNVPAISPTDRLRVFVAQGPTAISQRRRLNHFVVPLDNWQAVRDFRQSGLPPAP